MEERVFPYWFLPDPVRAFFLDSGLEDLAFIVKTNGLSSTAEDALDTIQQEVLFGYEPVDKVINLLKTRLGYDTPLAAKVALDLIQRRFLPIDAYLQSQAFRTFAQLGGNVTVVSVPHVERSALTVTQVRKNVDAFVEEARARRAEEESAASEERATTEKTVRQDREAFVETVQKLDARMDADDEPTVGEAQEELASELDPSHELSPPPPALVDAQKSSESRASSRKRRRLRSPIQSMEHSAPPSLEPPSIQKERRTSILDLDGEAEVAKIVEDLKASGTHAPRSIEHPKIDEIQRKLSLSFASSDLNKRFRVILGSRLSGVRSESDFQLALSRSVEEGGLGLNPHTVDRVMEAVEGHRVERHTESANKAAAEKSEYVKSRQARHSVPNASLAPLESSPTPKPMARAGLGERPPVQDVTYARRLVGPLEELRRMRIEDVRRIPGSVEDAKAALLDDIEQIAKHDPGQRIQASDAWRESPLVKAYQRILAASLQKGVPVRQVLGDKQVNPGDLTLDEFNLVRTLNAALRL